jgi:uncharacterized OB-fold protein
MNEMIPIREGVFRQTADGAVLIGSRCRNCQHVHFPPTKLCLECRKGELDDVELSRNGTLFSHTTVHMRAPHFNPPYQVGYVKLPEGVTIFAPLRSVGVPLKVGMAMSVEVVPLWTENDKDMIGYRFFPA